MGGALRSHIVFEDRGRSPSGKTRRLVVLNTERTSLGYIQWVTGWRRYCFFPTGQPYFDAGCLGEIASKLIELMEERK